MWSDDRRYYGSERLPDARERILLDALCKLHWLRIRTISNLRAIERPSPEFPTE
ncbi:MULTISPECIES: hypothetical protein [unclassified Bradyrhizobium]